MGKFTTTAAANRGSKYEQQRSHFTQIFKHLKAVVFRLTPFILAMGAFHV